MTMKPTTVTGLSIFALALAGGLAFAAGQYGPGASDSEIKIGNTMPYSGPASAYGTIGKAEAAYFTMVNEQGGINGRKINFISRDDGYSPPKTVEVVRKLVEEDQVLLVFNPLGTPPNTAIRGYLNDNKVPQLFVATGADKWNDPKNFPWTMGYQPSYRIEARIYGRYILKELPNAKIALLYQNDDFGKDYLIGLREGLGDKADKMLVATKTYETTDPTVDSQIVSLQGSGADVLVTAAIPKFAAQAIRNAGKIDQVKVYASGEGSQLDCDQVNQGNFYKFLSYKATEQGHDLMFAAETLLESGDKPGTRHLEYYTRPIWLDKSNANGANCFALPKK